MNKSLITIALVAAGVAVAGCAPSTPDNRAAFADVRSAVQSRGGGGSGSDGPIQWRGRTESDAELDRAVEALLRQPELSADAAVQVALLNNRSLQGAYEELAVARADLVQAGLLRNPVFDASIRFPDRSPRGPNVELSVTQEFLELLFLPARKRLAARQFEAAKWRATAAVVELACDVRAAWYGAVAARQMLELRRTVAQASDAAAEMADRMRAGGTLGELDAAAQQAMAEQAKLDASAAEAELLEARERLSALMGAGGDQETRWQLPARLPEAPLGEISSEDLEALAMRQRADLAAGREAVAAAGAALGLTEQSRLLPELQIGADTEREPGGTRVTGPTVSLPIPLLDTGSAAVDRQRALLRQSQDRYEALAVQIRSDVRRARDRMLAARQRAESYQKTLLPLRHRITEQTQLQYNAMLVGVFQLVEAKRAEIAAGREYIEALRDQWLARTALDRAVGGRLQQQEEKIR